MINLEIAKSNITVMYEVLNHIMTNGYKLAPRGVEILEVEDAIFNISPAYPCMSFVARNFKLIYAKQEWIWKLSGNRYNSSIVNHAGAWASLKDVDGGYNSNYGQYFFGTQNGFGWVIEELIRDKDSRRAAIPLMNASHLRNNNPDHVCTESITFRIRNNHLNMSVNMRSNDFIWGFTNDAITFSLLYRMVYITMLHYYPELKVGNYCHKADSLHIYSRHWPMATKMLSDGLEMTTVVDIPWPSSILEVNLLIATEGKLTLDQLAKYDIETPFYKWLVS